MTALFNEAFASDKALVQSQAAACRAAFASRPAVTAAAFPGLAVRFAGVVPAGYGEVEKVLGDAGEMGRGLVEGHGRFAGWDVTREEYEAYVARLAPSSSAAAATTQPDVETRREACLSFFKHYAFQVPPSQSTTASSPSTTTPTTTSSSTTTREASIYLLASLINHRCTPPPSTSSHHTSSANSSSSSSSSGPNCSWRIGPSGLAHFVRPRHICVQARRAIRAGEQLTWDYGKREKGFACECDTCRGGGFMAGFGMGESCRVL